MGIKDIKGLPVSSKNLISFTSINVDIPISSLLSGERKINLTIQDPLVEINEKITSAGGPGLGSNSKFSINKINLKNGELRYTTDQLSVTLLNFDVFSFSKGENISFRMVSPHLKVIFPLSKEDVKLEGDLESEFINKNKVFKISKFRWGTEDFTVTGNGNIYKNGTLALHVFTDGNLEKLLYPILKNLSLSGDVQGNATIVKDTSGRVLISGNFNAPEISINDEKFRQFRGTAKWNNRTKTVRVNSSQSSDGLAGTIDVESRKGLTKIVFANTGAAKVCRAIGVYDDVPMGGVIRKGEVELIRSHLTATVSVEKEIVSESEFNVSGNFDIGYHTKEKWINFKTVNAVSEFGPVKFLNGAIDSRKKTIDLDLNCNITEISGADKYLKKYADLDLGEWGLRNGLGNARVNVRKRGKSTEIRSNLAVKDVVSNGASLDAISVEVLAAKNRTDVTLAVRDRELTGTAFLSNESGNLKIDFREIRGESSKIFKILKKSISLRGNINGDFTYLSEKGKEFPLITGTYSGRSVSFYDFIFNNVRGDLEILDYISLKNLEFDYHKGNGRADILINYDTEFYDINGRIDSIDVNELNRGFSGRGDLTFSGKGRFNQDPIRIGYNFPELSFYTDRTFAVSGEGEITTDYSDFLIKAPGTVSKNGIRSTFNFELGFQSNKYRGAFNLDLKDINKIMPWENNRGVMILRSEISSDPDGSIHFQGVADFEGGHISFPGFPHTLDDFKGSLFFRDLDFTMRSFSGKMGGGDVTGNGKLRIEDNEIKDLFFSFNGKNMFLFPMERASFRMNAKVNLQKKKEKFILGGAVDFLSLLWEREVDEGVSFYSGSGDKDGGQSKFLDNLEFDLLLRGKQDINVRNAFIRGKGAVDLKLTGNTDFPVLSGTITSRDGVVLISGKEFSLVNARLFFNNKVRINPVVRLDAETFIKSYRIKFLISGLSSNVRPEFISSPPLPQQDIIALISLGELFKRSSSTNISSEVGTTGLVTTALTDQIQKRVKKLFGIDMLKLDPDPTRSSLEGASRLTVGKSITKGFLIVYSTDISRGSRDVYFFQYQITPTISLIGKRNEEGRLSLDIRFRKRY